MAVFDILELYIWLELQHDAGYSSYLFSERKKKEKKGEKKSATARQCYTGMDFKTCNTRGANFSMFVVLCRNGYLCLRKLRICQLCNFCCSFSANLLCGRERGILECDLQVLNTSD